MSKKTDDGPVVMATGNTTVSTDGVHADPEEQATDGPVVETIELVLPLVENVPALASVALVGTVLVNCVAETATSQPAPLPVASLTMYDWSAVLTSAIFRSRPVKAVLAHVRLDGAVRAREPPVTVGGPTSVQGVGAVTAPALQATACAVAASRTGAPTAPVSSTQTDKRRVSRLQDARVRCPIPLKCPR